MEIHLIGKFYANSCKQGTSIMNITLSHHLTLGADPLPFDWLRLPRSTEYQPTSKNPLPLTYVTHPALVSEDLSIVHASDLRRVFREIVHVY